jgi:hypothetical protein
MGVKISAKNIGEPELLKAASWEQWITIWYTSLQIRISLFEIPRVDCTAPDVFTIRANEV